MNLRQSILAWLLYGLYPLWLVAGMCDYLCHRRTRIEQTSGVTESNLHLLQFTSLAIALACVVVLPVSAFSAALAVICVITHTLLAYIDLLFTDGRRYISPFEQMVHSFMTVLPIAAISLFVILHWQLIIQNNWKLELVDSISPGEYLLLGSYLLLGGLPLLEERYRVANPFPQRRRSL